MSIDPKLANPSSFYFAQGLDNRTKPSQMTVLPAFRTIADNLTDLITAMTQDLNGIRWGVGTNGGLYSIDASDVMSRRAQLTENGSAGLYYNQVTDQLYIPGQTAVSMFGQVTSTQPDNPNFLSNQFAQSASQAPGCVSLFNPSTGFYDGTLGYRNNAVYLAIGITKSTLDNVITNSIATYTLPKALSEAPIDLCAFAPDIEPFYSVMVYITAPGSGNWTLTLHDSLNNQLATKTLSNTAVVAALNTSNYVEFKFGFQVRAIVNASQTGNSATYHFHLTSSVANDTATVGTLVASNLSSVDFLLFAYRLVQTNNGWHPTALFTGGGTPLLCVLNGQYLSTYNFGNDANPSNSQWQRHNLQFQDGYEGTFLTTLNQYLAIGVERRSKNSSRNSQDGAIYLWDGTTNAPSVFVDIPMGSPYAGYSFNNVIYYACAGSLMAYAATSPIKVRKLAYQNTDYLGAIDSTIVNPNMFTSRYNILEMGYPSSTTNANINYGVYTWGTVELTFPNSYMYSYTLANQMQNNTGDNNLQIGCVQNFVDSMYMSWQYTDTNGQVQYGMDLLDNFSVSQPTFIWQSLVWDGGVSWKIKKGARVKVGCVALPEGSTLQVGYSLDGGDWIWSPAVEAGAVGQTIDINKRFHELQYGFQGTTSGTTTPPDFRNVTFDVDPLPDEINLVAEQ